MNEEMADKTTMSINVILNECGDYLVDCHKAFIDLCSYYYIWDRDIMQSTTANKVSYAYSESLNIQGERNHFINKAVPHRDFLLLSYYNLLFMYGILYQTDYPDSTATI